MIRITPSAGRRASAQPSPVSHLSRKTPSTHSERAGVSSAVPSGDVECPDDEDAYPHTVRVPTDVDMFGNPTEFVECDPEASGQWDPACWRDRPKPSRPQQLPL